MYDKKLACSPCKRAVAGCFKKAKGYCMQAANRHLFCHSYLDSSDLMMSENSVEEICNKKCF